MKRLSSALFLSLIFALTAFAQGQAKYVFYFIGDGMGADQVNGTEMYLAEKEGRIGVKPLLFTQFPVASVANTYSKTNSITDSSAAGTALATGVKTFNGAIGVNKDKEKVLSVAARAKQAGKKVGVLTSVSVDHATPAAFFAHQVDRNMYYEIATDLPKSGFDFYGGAGFLRPDKNAEDEEVTSIYTLFSKKGHKLYRGLDAYSKSKRGQKVILIQDEGKSSHALPYAIDRKSGDLKLKDLTAKAIEHLSAKNNDGFFMMVEGGKIDWACHDNDAATVFNEVIDMDEAIAEAYEFYKKHPDETLIVVTADHETGGMALGLVSGYDLNLKALSHQKISAGELSNKINELRKEKNNNVSWEEAKALLTEYMGFWSELKLNWKQERKLRDAFEESFIANKKSFEESMYTKSEPLAARAKEVMNEIAGIGWTTKSHSANFVPVFAIGAGSELFNARLNNIDIPRNIAKAAGYTW